MITKFEDMKYELVQLGPTKVRELGMQLQQACQQYCYSGYDAPLVYIFAKNALLGYAYSRTVEGQYQSDRQYEHFVNHWEYLKEWWNAGRQMPRAY